MRVLCNFQTILDAILPHYLEHIKQQTVRRDNPSAAREEINCLCNIAVSLRALVSSCEPLARYEFLSANKLLGYFCPGCVSFHVSLGQILLCILFRVFIGAGLHGA